MDSVELGKYLSVFVASTVFFSKLGVPSAIAAFQGDFVKAILAIFAGSTFSAIIFTNLSDVIIKGWDKFKDRWFSKPKHPKKVFTSSNRRIIKIKQRFGLLGITALTPILLSIPLGAFLAERFYKNKKKVIIYIAFFNLLWAIVLYFSYFYLWQKIKLLFGI